MIVKPAQAKKPAKVFPANLPKIVVRPPGTEAAPLSEMQYNAARDGLVATVISMICHEYGIAPERIRSESRMDGVVSARRCIDNVLTQFNLSMPEIARRVYGIVHHAGVNMRLQQPLTPQQAALVEKVKRQAEATRFAGPINLMTANRAHPHIIIESVATVMGMSVPILRGNRRSKNMVRARAVAAWVIHRRGGYSLADIGELIRDIPIDHSAVGHYFKMVKSDPELMRIADLIESNIVDKEAA